MTESNSTGAPQGDTRRFVTHARVVAVMTLISRVSGVFRDAACSRTFGTGPVWSAFSLAFVIPNLFRRLFGEGALSAAFLPEYARLRDSDPQAARQFAALVIGGLVMVLSVAVLLLEAVLGIWFFTTDSAVAPDRSLFLMLAMIMVPYTVLVCVVAVLGAMLQSHDRFAPTAAAPIILNLGMIVAAIVVYRGMNTGEDATISGGIHLVAWSVMIAGALQVVWSLFALRSQKPFDMSLTAILKPEITDRGRAMIRMWLPMVFGLAVIQINVLLDHLIAGYAVVFGPTIFGVAYPLDDAAASVIFYAQRLYQFPLGIFGIAIATAIYPQLSRLANDTERFSETVRHGLRLTMFIGLPASVGLIFVREPLTAVILEGGLFSADDVSRVASVLLAYASAIWAYSMVHILTRVFYAKGDAMAPVKIATGMVALNLVLNLIFIWFIGEAGLAWSTALCAVLQCVLLTHKLGSVVERLVDHTVWAGWRRTIFATAIMAGLVFLVDRYVLIGEDLTWLGRLGELALLIVVGGLAYGVTVLITKAEEVRWLFRS